jgi:UDP-glucose:(heptosyl)LPS alpha-1,3-glucosyltransferase
MRVGIVIDDLDRRRGGLSEWCWQFVDAAARRGYELHVVAQGFGAEPLHARVSQHKVDRTGSRLTFAESAERLLRGLNLDVVHDTGLGWHFDFFQPHGGSYAAWLGRRLDMYPWWYRAVKWPIDALLPRHRNFARHWRRQEAAAQRSDKTLIAISNMVADDFARLSGIRSEQIAVVHNGVDCQRFSPRHRAAHRSAVRKRLGVQDGTLILLMAAHNFRLKGVPELLRVTGRMVSNGHPLHVVIAGGKRLDGWRRTAASVGLQNHATFLGTVTDMVPYYAAADAYVQPTYYDPCSLVLLEAAASGLPIVTTRHLNGAVELFCDGAEILTVDNPAAEDALYELIEALFDERLRERLGVAARKVALRNTMERNAAAILQLYQGRAGRRLAA